MENSSINCEIFGNDEKEHEQYFQFLSYLFSNVTEEERTIVILHVVGGLKHHEIAKMMDIPLGTVLSKYKRTINKLKNIAKEDSHVKEGY